MDFTAWIAFIVAEVGLMPIVIAMIGTGGVSAGVTAAVSFRRMKVQNTVDVRTVAAKEAEVAVQGFRELLTAQASHIARQDAQIEQLRSDVARCEERCRALEVRRRDG